MKKKWNDIFKPPFTNVSNLYIYDGTNEMCFECLIDETNENTKEVTELYDNIASILNGETTCIDGYWTHDAETIYRNYVPVLCVRGFGFLNGGLKMSVSETIKIQTDLLEYVYNKLNNY